MTMERNADRQNTHTGAAGRRLPWVSRRQRQTTLEGKFVGCLLGGAVGDALGAPVEFMQRDDILRKFGANGITRYVPAYGRKGAITDDTQMTLFTAEGLLRGWVRGCEKGITSYTDTIAHAYLRWLLTQGIEPSRSLFFHSENDPGWLIQQRALHARRAPGNTCLSALQAMTHLDRPVSNNSKGCGGVMRVAPVGLFFWRLEQAGGLEQAFTLACEAAALTHRHPSGYLTAGVLAALVLALVDGASLPDALEATLAILRRQRDHEETLLAIEQAQRFAAQPQLAPADAIAQLGEGWVAEEALAIGIYCALVAPTLRQGVILAVNHSGDSDSTGSIAGNLLGAQHGVKAIPKTWLRELELKAVIETLATDLYAFRSWSLGPYCEDAQSSEAI